MLTKKKIDEAKGVCFLSLSILLFLSLISYTPQDVKFLTTSPNIPAKNFIGIVGAYVSFTFFFVLGFSSYLVCALLFIKGLSLLFKNIKLPQSVCTTNFSKALFYIFFILSFSGLLSSLFFKDTDLAFKSGGLVGFFTSKFLNFYLGRVGSYLILLTFLILSSLSLFGLSLISFFFSFLNKFFPKRKQLLKPKQKIEVKSKKEKLPQIIKVKKKEAPQMFSEVKDEKLTHTEKKEPSQLSLKLLDEVPPLSERKIDEDLKENAKILVETLQDFGVDSKVTDIEKGPTVTRYELELAPGIKLQKIYSLADDIALALKAPSVRIVAPILGKGTVGIEVPNTQKEIVFLREVLESEEFKKAQSPLTLALGKDVSGRPVIVDLKELPHLLIAGTTGSGKTVCINSILVSLLFKSQPNTVKLLLIDPKMVELSIFNEIPHLLCPVIQDVNKACKALSWMVEEMERRYKTLAQEGVRNIDSFNKKEFRMPFIVVVIDELADLMLQAKDKMESLILRLAQLARAVGIHLILATQRPSVDVITGVIKANFPARISFRVASKVDSRTVLDFTGADKLLGKGDMLFLKPDMQRPIRCQGSFITDKEIRRVVDHLKENYKPEYDQELLKFLSHEASYKFDKDPLYEEAVKVVLETGYASVSVLQRRLHLSYVRAARLIDMMEAEGIIGPFQGSKPRQILISKDEWEREKRTP